uniref:Uncharacterized protein n=1 Tax=Anguilla anguilla TaxID=7936 RepID=A0A0E9TBD0_ANGAN
MKPEKIPEPFFCSAQCRRPGCGKVFQYTETRSLLFSYIRLFPEGL